MLVFSGTSVLLGILTVLSFSYLQSILCRSLNDIFIDKIANFSANPCEDFYEYACGNFETVFKNENPGSTFLSDHVTEKLINNQLKYVLEFGLESTTRATKAAQEYYRSCRYSDLRDFSSFLKIIEEFGYWPTYRYNTNWTAQRHFRSLWNINDFMIKALKYQAFPLFKISVSHEVRSHILISAPDLKESEYKDYRKDVIEALEMVEKAHRKNFGDKTLNHVENLIGTMMKTRRNLYQNLRTNKFTRVYQFYFDAIMKTLIGIDSSYRTFYSKTLTEDEETIISNTWKLERDFLKALQTDEGNTEEYTYMSLKELDIFSQWGLDWRKILEAHFQTKLEPDTVVGVKKLSYFRKLPSILEKHSNSKYMVDPVTFTLVHGMIYTVMFTGWILSRYSGGVQLEEQCLFETVDKFKFATARLFFDKQMEDLKKGIKSKKVDKIAENIRKEAMRLKLEFFDDETWNQANLKLDKARILSLYPEFIFNDTALEEYYKSYDGQGDFLLKNLQHALFRTSIQRWEYSQDHIDPQYLFGFPLDQSEVTDIRMNWVYIYAGMVSKPFYHVFNDPPEIEYGSFGGLVAKHLMYLILPPGSDYDVHGTVNNWWSDVAKVKFKNHEKCFTNSHNKMTMFGKPINGNLTKLVAMKEAGGLYVAYKALERSLGKDRLQETTSIEKLNLTKAQTFFLAYAQTLCGTYNERNSESIFKDEYTFRNIRMKGTLQNNKEFAEAFNCPSGSAYNPENKCQLHED